MMFTRRMFGWATFGRAILAAALMAAGATVGITPAHAQPTAYHVKYTVWSDQPFFADIYYRDTDPPNFAAYSHNPYEFSPRAQVDIGPDRPWVHEAVLTNPYRWAMVTATSGLHTAPPTFHCQLELNGQVVAADTGPKGALCSIRHW